MKHTTHNKHIIATVISLVLALATVLSLSSCGSSTEIADLKESVSGLETEIKNLASQLSAITSQVNLSNGKLDDVIEVVTPKEEEVIEEPACYAQEAYDKVVYIDSTLSDRDCFAGGQFKLTQKWIKWNLLSAGYTEDDIQMQPVTITRYVSATKDLKTTFPAAASYSTDGKLYKKSGRNYVEDEAGTYVKVDVVTENIIVTKKGSSDKQIIVGAHYDGDGSGDNGSGVALALTTAEKFHSIDTTYTIVFVFFTAEEYGCYGSTAYANAMSETEIANTLYMINMDSLICGDYVYLYGGVQDDEKQIVTETEAYDNAQAVAKKLGIEFKTNPWTYESPAPGYKTPDYASPSTGDWSDHVGFKNVGVKYVYFEATNWEIPGPYAEYDGYGETYLIGMLMNTSNDYLEYIEKYFPGRPLAHLEKFSTLLNALLLQSDIDF